MDIGILNRMKKGPEIGEKYNKKLAEQALYLNAILSSMEEGLILIDKKSNVILMNQAAGILLRMAPNEAMGKNVHKLLSFWKHEGNLQLRKFPIKEALAEESVVNIGLKDDIYCKNKSGNMFPVQMSITGLLNHKGNIGGLIVFTDITKAKEIDRMKTEFVSVASHQLRTPLTAMQLFLEMLDNGEVGKLNEKQAEYVDNIYLSARRMVILVNDLLNVSRLEMGKLKIEPKAIQLESFIQNIIKETEVIWKKSKCNIDLQVPKTALPKVRIDQTLMRQVIHNLLVNAIHYSPSNRCSITVQIKKEKKAYMISIQDRGIGIPESTKSQIFEKFFRADNAMKIITEGTGLGLYVSKIILDAAGGEIWFESREGKGTTFYVTIPIEGMQEKKGERNLISHYNTL